jgi:hypothetical protein
MLLARCTTTASARTRRSRSCAAPFLAHIVRYGAFEDKILNYDGAFTGGVTEDNVESFLRDVDPSRLGGFVREGGRSPGAAPRRN